MSSVLLIITGKISGRGLSGSVREDAPCGVVGARYSCQLAGSWGLLPWTPVILWGHAEHLVVAVSSGKAVPPA